MGEVNFNKVTRELERVGEEKLAKNKRKNFLNIIKKIFIKLRRGIEYNKVFFEIFSTVILGIMGIIISSVGLNINYKTTDIYQRQLEILENDREPYFIIKCDTIDARYNANDYEYIKNKYTIKNEGGLISQAYIDRIRKVITIYSPYSENGTQNVYRFYFEDLFDKTEKILSLYNDKNKEFIFYERETNKIENIIKLLQSEIMNENIKKGNWQFGTETILSIQYINYKNEEYDKTYTFRKHGGMVLLSDIKKENEDVFLGYVSINEDIEIIVRKICDKIKEYNFTGKIDRVLTPGYGDEKGKESAITEAKFQLEHYAYSYERLIDQIEKEGYLKEQAVYAADNCGADWNQQAILKAQSYMPLFYGRPRKDIIEQMEKFDKFTHEQAIYGVVTSGFPEPQ